MPFTSAGTVATLASTLVEGADYSQSNDTTVKWGDIVALEAFRTGGVLGAEALEPAVRRAGGRVLAVLLDQHAQRLGAIDLGVAVLVELAKGLAEGSVAYSCALSAPCCLCFARMLSKSSFISSGDNLALFFKVVPVAYLFLVFK